MKKFIKKIETLLLIVFDPFLSRPPSALLLPRKTWLCFTNRFSRQDNRYRVPCEIFITLVIINESLIRESPILTSLCRLFIIYFTNDFPFPNHLSITVLKSLGRNFKSPLLCTGCLFVHLIFWKSSSFVWSFYGINYQLFCYIVSLISSPSFLWPIAPTIRSQNILLCNMFVKGKCVIIWKC